MSKISWRVETAPTGRWRSFFKRGWPTGYSGRNGEPVARITCDTDYEPRRLKSADHNPLRVSVAIKNKNPSEEGAWSWRRLKGEWSTLVAAKEAAQKFYDAHEGMFP
jgi:hypothetical protein